MLLKTFTKKINLTGSILTRIDGDARGGAALSLRMTTGCPIKFIGNGEKIDDLEIFHPDRIANRILDMGDVVTLVEKAAENIDQLEAEKIGWKIATGRVWFKWFVIPDKSNEENGWYIKHVKIYTRHEKFGR